MVLASYPRTVPPNPLRQHRFSLTLQNTPLCEFFLFLCALLALPLASLVVSQLNLAQYTKHLPAQVSPQTYPSLFLQISI